MVIKALLRVTVVEHGVWPRDSIAFTKVTGANFFLNAGYCALCGAGTCASSGKPSRSCNNFLTFGVIQQYTLNTNNNMSSEEEICL